MNASHGIRRLFDLKCFYLTAIARECYEMVWLPQWLPFLVSLTVCSATGVWRQIDSILKTFLYLLDLSRRDSSLKLLGTADSKTSSKIDNAPSAKKLDFKGKSLIGDVKCSELLYNGQLYFRCSQGEQRRLASHQLVHAFLLWLAPAGL